MAKTKTKRPVTEALCEFFFIPQEAWDMTIPGIIYSSIQDKFPIKKQEVGKGAFLKTEKGVEKHIDPIPPRLLFFNQAEDMLIQVSPNVLSINVFRPRVKWGLFKQLIKYALSRYIKAAEPEGFDKIGLRYITRFDIDDNPSNMDDYLTIYPQIPPEFPHAYEEYDLSLRINYKEKRDYLLLHSELMEIDEKKKSISLLLDLNYSMDKRNGVKRNQLEEWLDSAHNELNKLMISSLTEKTKVMFGMGDLPDSGSLVETFE